MCQLDQTKSCQESWKNIISSYVCELGEAVSRRDEYLNRKSKCVRWPFTMGMGMIPSVEGPKVIYRQRKDIHVPPAFRHWHPWFYGLKLRWGLPSLGSLDSDWIIPPYFQIHPQGSSVLLLSLLYFISWFQ